MSPGSTVTADVCIVGGGAAGITIACELLPGNVSVCLLESGGEQADPASADLDAGVSRGTVLDQQSGYLTRTRARHLGGATNLWNGYCRPLDPLDFEPRPWVAWSGWPFRREHLEPYYLRACAPVYIAPFDYDLRERRGGRPLLDPEGPVRTSLYHLSTPVRFGQAFAPTLAGAGNVTALLRSNAIRIALDRSGTAVDHVDVACLGGNRFAVRARRYVLAAGGIENARLLLLSDDVHRGGVGNQNDLVGRYFMEHPYVDRFGYLALPHRAAAMGLYRGYRDRRLTHRVVGLLTLAPEVQEREKLLAGVLRVVPLPGRELAPLAHDVAGLAGRTDALRGAAPDPSQEDFHCRVLMSGEQAPDPDSRVTLGDDRDALGQRRVVVDWRIADGDMLSLHRTFALMAREIGLKARGRAAVVASPERPFQGVSWSSHHIGTTRMHTDPRQGVVDGDCRVHGVANLFVAGSSVFPAAGGSEPTYTLVALAIRLADHLKRTLRG